MIKKLLKQRPRFIYTRNMLLLAISSFISASSWANNWYVNDNSLTGDVFTTAIGSDANAGTPAAPFATIQFAINAAATGDTIYVDAGTYASADINITTSVVLRGAKFGIPAGPSPIPANRGTDETIVQAGVYYGQSRDNIAMDGFTIDAGTLIRAIEARGLNSVIINNIVTGTVTPFVQQAGISTRANAPNRTHSYLIANNNVQGFRYGIYMDGNTELASDIVDNYVSGCFSAGFVLTASEGHRLRRNISVNNSTGLLCLRGNNLITENTFTGNILNGIRLVGNATDFGNSILNNFITGNNNGINLTEDNPSAINNSANYNFLALNVTNIQNDHSAQFNATCNWFGSTNAGVIATQIVGSVLFNPFLGDGIDTDLAADGFQPLTTCIVTPVVLTSFTAVAKNYDVLLDWQTASEVNSSHFNIERSLDGQRYTTIGRVEASGFSNVKVNYHFTDNKPANFDKPTYFRIAMVDRDGTLKYTKVIAVTLKATGSYVQQVYPNPVKAGAVLYTDFISGSSQKVSISFVNSTGQVLYNYEFQAFKGTNKFNIPVPAVAASGVNFLLIKSGSNVKQVPVYIH